MHHKAKDIENILFASYGNDSLALIEWAHENKLKNVCVCYSDTGWAADWWPDRVRKGEAWAKSLEFEVKTIHSEGMKELVRRKKMFPQGGGGKFQFCTFELKKKPALEWMNSIDPDKEITCYVGIRREESRNRAAFPEWTEESEGHGGRSLCAPLVRHTAKMRDELIAKTPFEPLPHRSKECWPCVNCNKGELKFLEESRLAEIEQFEQEMGINTKGNARVLFSPRRHNGAIGIRAVVEDAKKGMEDFWGLSCDSGWCGD